MAEAMSSSVCEAGPSNCKNGVSKKMSFTAKLKNMIQLQTTAESTSEVDDSKLEVEAHKNVASYDLFDIYDYSDEEADEYPLLEEAKDEIDTETVRVHEEALRDEFSFYEPSIPFLPPIDSVVERRSLTIRGSQRQIEPITDSIEKTHLFSKELKSRLKEAKLTTATPIQAHLWPNIARGSSICCIATSKSGKTSSYLVSILQSLSRLTNESPEIGSGPNYVIVCSGFKVVQNVLDVAMNLKGSAELPRFIDLDSFNEEQQTRKMLNGCEVIISTPLPLLRLMDTHPDYFKNCTTLIFDDCDKTLELHFATVKEIFAKFLVQSKKRLTANEKLNRALYVQTMIYSEKWTDKVEQFYGTQSRSILLFGNYFEATIYKKLRNKVTLVNDDEKMRHVALKDILTDLMETLKFGEYDNIAIVCRDYIEADSVAQTVRKLKVDSRKVEAVILNETSPHYEHQNLIARWQTGQEILIITDEAIQFFPQVSNIRLLIHFSLPPLSNNTFGARFQLMYHVLRKDDLNNPPLSHIIFSEENERQVLELHKYLERCQSDIPPTLTKLKESISLRLCHSFLSLGFCRFKKYFCKFRHSFKNEKAIAGFPVDGEVKGKIRFIRSPNEFYFMIEEYRNKSSYKWKKFERQMPLTTMNERLQKLRDSDVLECITEVKVNDLYAIVVRETVHRVKIVEDLGQQLLKGYQTTEKERNSTQVILFHIDFGYYTRAQSYDLIPLPASLKHIPPFANKVFFMGIKPPDNEIEWNAKSTQTFFEKVMVKSVTHVTFWVRLQLNGDLWADALTTWTKFSQIGVEVVSSKPTNYLIEKKLAERNAKKLANFNNNRSEVLSKWTCERQKSIVQYAFIDDSLCEFFLCHFVSLDHFYVRFAKFDDILMNLEDEITAQEKLKPIHFFVIGLICLCRHESGILNRVKIEEVLDESVKVFFLDHGETNVVQKQSCFYIAEKFVSRLPFQAIRCKLNGVVAEKIDANIIYDYTRFENEQFKLLLLQKLAVEAGACVVRLFVKRDQDKPVIYDRVSKWLVDNNHAKYSNDDEMKSDETQEVVGTSEDVADDSSCDENSDSDDPEIRFWDKCLGLDELKKLAKANGLNGYAKKEIKSVKKESRFAKFKKRIEKIKSEENGEEEKEKEPFFFPDDFGYEIDKSVEPLPYDPMDDMENNEDDGEIIDSIDDDCSQINF